MARRDTKLVSISPVTPQAKRIERAVEIIRKGGIIVYPTDTVYGIGCSFDNKSGIEQIKRLKGKKEHQPFSFICSSLQEVSLYATFDTNTFRVMKRVLPGPYTFILEASKNAPRSVMSKRNKVGIRIPDHPVPLNIVEMLGNPIITTSVNVTGEPHFTDPEQIDAVFGHGVDIILDSGVLESSSSTIVEWTNRKLELIREGKGEVDFLD